MKNILVIMAAVIIMAGSTLAYASGTHGENSSVKVLTSIENSALQVGNNEVTVELTDHSGHSITEAEVDIYYYMPSMPAMNYEVKSSLIGKKYASIIKPVMPGEWTADIKVMKSGKLIKKVSVNFDVK